MDAPVTGGVPRVFQTLPDPRGRTVRHLLSDILTIALCAVICGAGEWVAVGFYARMKQAWFESFLELPNGIPSHDTFRRGFARLDPAALEQSFRAWMSQMVDRGGGKLVAFDGKSLRRSFEQSWDKSGMVHMVSPFVQANRLVLAQVAAAGKGKELEGIAQLLKLLDLEGAVVTIDALGCQTSIAALIGQAKADYLLQVKDNQPTWHAKVRTLVAEAVLEKMVGWRGDSCQEQPQGGHRRIETRKVGVTWTSNIWGKYATSGPDSGAWRGWNGPGPSTAKPARSSITTSLVSTAASRPASSWNTAGDTGVWKTTCTGNWR